MRSLPRILVVDDQYARDTAERVLFLEHANLLVDGENPEVRRGEFKYREAVAEVVICSGQRRDENVISNDYGVIRDAITAEDGWALVLLDVRFDSGPLQEGGFPAGQPSDDTFGEVVSRRLAQDFPDLTVVMLSSMRQQDLNDQRVPYLSKEGLGERELKACLLRHGRLSSDQALYLLGLGKDIVAQSERTISVFREAFTHVVESVSIIILGESGSGKEVLAKYIHRASGRSGPFVAVNIAAIPKDLLESELFGVEKGTATGVGERPGKFELANGGTLFLDEIGDMPLDAQAKVLRALQERKVMRVGGWKLIPLDVRLITATSRDLPWMIEEGTFREDLYYRINAVPLTMPPLRERPEDILPLAEAFLGKFMTASGKTGITLSSEAKLSLKHHSYPGNVRELENLVQRIISGTGNNRVISADEINAALGASYATSPVRQVEPPVDDMRKHQPARLTGVSLDALPTLLETVRIDLNASALAGAKLRLEKAFRILLQRLAGTALERCRDPVSGELNRQRAMQLLTGDSSLKGKGPARVVNEILGRRQEERVTDEDLEALIRQWKEKND